MNLIFHSHLLNTCRKEFKVGSPGRHFTVVLMSLCNLFGPGRVPDLRPTPIFEYKTST